MNGEEYEFHIDAFTPATLPMARLAEYLRELSLLIGNTHSVHFKKIKSGSVGVVANVEREAVPKVRVRLHGARDPNAPDDVRRPYERIDNMLREDNAIGKLTRGATNVIKFPGREAAKSIRMGPFTEQSSMDGKIVRIGGTDTTAHALIEIADGEIVSAECSRELAKQLAPYLYGVPIRLTGNARRERTDLGEWKLISFRAKEFSTLNADDLATVIGRLRGLDADWKKDGDPVALMRKIRGNDGSTH